MANHSGLGFGAEERVVVVHVDDVGMSNAANEGAFRALEADATCGSVMVPCPAFEAAAEIASGRDDLDLGVHLTLNAEYETWRWGTVSDDAPSLLSPDGGMWRTTVETVEHASAEDVETELRAQVERALEAGVDVTHLDSHMGTVFDPKFVDVYVQLARHYRLPVFIPRVDRSVAERRGLSGGLKHYVEMIDEAEADGFPIFEGFNADSLEFEPGTGLAHNTARVASLPPGLSYLITHCAQGGDELRSITHDWRQRDEESRIYSDGSMGRAFREQGVHTIGMRELRDLLRDR
ncbi:MAG: ChbG/HpnK family deacetylase [Deltaproteobacteria bacterium]|nr:ChbG/HpnK family deacetylase [Deltaproteobacteria bacterium]MBW2413209.1 ChbG/HpnK family deacetylase [Deltaproteobacteria bacterium]